MVTARQAWRKAVAVLEEHQVADAGFDAAQLLLHAGGPDVRLFPDAPLTQPVLQALETYTARRARREPLQYILGTWDFMDLTLAVGPGVLIPRPDTELAAQLAIEAARQIQEKRKRGLHGSGPVRAVDLCSGSGALALALARHVPGIQIAAVELSKQAFAYLERNNRACGAPLELVCADALCWAPQYPADVVVSNPPYVTQAEYAGLEPELYAEPKMALVPAGGEADGLLFYRSIAGRCGKLLAPGGRLILEIGDTQGRAAAEICRAAGLLEVAVHQDWNGRDRVVTARMA